MFQTKDFLIRTGRSALEALDDEDFNLLGHNGRLPSYSDPSDFFSRNGHSLGMSSFNFLNRNGKKKRGEDTAFDFLGRAGKKRSAEALQQAQEDPLDFLGRAGKRSNDGNSEWKQEAPFGSHGRSERSSFDFLNRVGK